MMVNVDTESEMAENAPNNASENATNESATDSGVTKEEICHHAEMVKSFTEFEREFRKHFPILWISTMLAPVVVSVFLLGVFWVSFGYEYVASIVGHALLTFFVLGRFVMLAGTNSQHALTMQPGELFFLVTYLDFMTALFVTFHMGILFRLPNIGPKIATLVADGKFIMESHPWLKRVAYLGLVGFVMFPTSTTGSIGGSIFGRLLGLSRWMTVSGVLLGSLLGNLVMYVFAKQINEYIQGNWAIKLVGIVIIVAAFFLLERRYRAIRDKYDSEEASA